MDCKISNIKPIAFKAIEYESVKPLLEEVLDESQKKRFEDTVEANKNNNLIEVKFYKKGDKKLSAYIGDSYIFHGYKDFRWKCSAPSQRQFESYTHFIDRVFARMDKRTAKLEEVAENKKYQFLGCNCHDCPEE